MGQGTGLGEMQGFRLLVLLIFAGDIKNVDFRENPPLLRVSTQEKCTMNNVINFPHPAVREALAIDSAIDLFDMAGQRSAGIEALMKLSLNGTDAQTRDRAGKFLEENCNMRIMAG